jgi:hypothetical protein
LPGCDTSTSITKTSPCTRWHRPLQHPPQPLSLLHRGRSFRAFFALKHGDLLNDDANENPANDDSNDLHQTFREAAVGNVISQYPNDLLIRVGRQELHYGSGRFICIRQGPNVRDDFDGVLLRYRANDQSVTDLLGFFEVDDHSGGFDNDTNFKAGFWGAYHSRPAGTLADNPLLLDAYYIGYQFNDSVFTTAVGDGTRHTLMLSPWIGGPPDAPGFGGDWEFVIQLGKIDTVSGSLDVFAYPCAEAVHYTFVDAPMTPTARLCFGYTSLPWET